MAEYSRRGSEQAISIDAHRLNPQVSGSSGAFEPDLAYERVLRATRELAGGDEGQLLLGGNQPATVASIGAATLPQRVVEEARHADKPMVVSDARTGRAYCWLPLPDGALVVGTPRGADAFTDRLPVLRVAAKQAAVAVSSVRLAAELADEAARLRRHELALERSEQLYRRAISQAGGVPYTLDYATSGYTFMGEEIEQLTGYTTAEFTPDFWEEMVEEAILTGEQAGLSDEEAVGPTRSGEFRQWRCDHRIRTKSGETRWIADASVEIIGDDGQSIGSIGMLQDITERKR